MSTLDREPRTSGGKSTPFCEPRVDPGAARPGRVNQPQRLAPKPPKTPNQSSRSVKR